MKNFEKYEPLDHHSQTSPFSDRDQDSGLPSSSSDSPPVFMTGRHKMVLDGVTLANLDVLVNSSSGTSEGTLLEVLDQCTTPFG